MDSQKRNVLLIGAVGLVVLILLIMMNSFSKTGGVILTGGAIENRGTSGNLPSEELCLNNCFDKQCSSENKTCLGDIEESCLEECNLE